MAIARNQLQRRLRPRRPQPRRHPCCREEGCECAATRPNTSRSRPRRFRSEPPLLERVSGGEAARFSPRSSSIPGRCSRSVSTSSRNTRLSMWPSRWSERARSACATTSFIARATRALRTRTRSLSRSRRSQPRRMRGTFLTARQRGLTRAIVSWMASAPCSSPAIRSSAIRRSITATTWYASSTTTRRRSTLGLSLGQPAWLCGPLRRASRSRPRARRRPVSIHAYIGSSARFDEAILGFAQAYADKTEADWDALCAGSSGIPRLRRARRRRFAGDSSATISFVAPQPHPRVLVTRSPRQSSELATQLSALGLEPVLVPAIELAPPSSFDALDAALAQLSSYDWLIFTSANAVEAFHRRLESAGTARRSRGAVRIAAIGPATARALESVGLAAEVIPPQAVAESLTEALLPHARQADGSATRFLLVRAEDARDVLPDALRAAGAEVTIAPAYRTVVPPGRSMPSANSSAVETPGIAAVDLYQLFHRAQPAGALRGCGRRSSAIRASRVYWADHQRDSPLAWLCATCGGCDGLGRCAGAGGSRGH